MTTEGVGSADINHWTESGHAEDYLERRVSIPFLELGYDITVGHLPASVTRVLDLGTGDGEMLSRVLSAHDGATGVGLDFSDTMLAAAADRLGDDQHAEIRDHDLNESLPADLGRFDLVTSSFAIHHVNHERKRELYGEIFDLLEPGGMFVNLEHVASPTEALHRRFLDVMGAPEDESNKLLDVDTQVDWLRTIGFDDADCHLKYYEIAMFAGTKPAGRPA